MAKHGTGHARYSIANQDGARVEIIVGGRDRWALENLLRAGERGCTPITHPGPRWSAYVFNLRTLGVEIETIQERHAGDYPGTHARYVLRCDVALVAQGADA